MKGQKCATCHLTWEMHQYPYPDRKHLFVPEGDKEEKKAMTEEKAAKKTLSPRRPCAICGKRRHQTKSSEDHAYEPMGEKAAVAREATQGGNGEDAEMLVPPPWRGRPRKAPPSADELRRRRTAKHLREKKAARSAIVEDSVERAIALAKRVADLLQQVDAAKKELRELLA